MLPTINTATLDRIAQQGHALAAARSQPVPQFLPLALRLCSDEKRRGVSTNTLPARPSLPRSSFSCKSGVDGDYFPLYNPRAAPRPVAHGGVFPRAHMAIEVDIHCCTAALAQRLEMLAMRTWRAHDDPTLQLHAALRRACNSKKVSLLGDETSLTLLGRPLPLAMGHASAAVFAEAARGTGVLRAGCILQTTRHFHRHNCV